mmetsp:Transcript_37872/g.61684  ORF Transcript_37872/g.61684 Transcript_37872/m.61684 type:complete len:212 (+) Transcript_37872:294-929(+)
MEAFNKRMGEGAGRGACMLGAGLPGSSEGRIQVMSEGNRRLRVGPLYLLRSGSKKLHNTTHTHTHTHTHTYTITHTPTTSLRTTLPPRRPCPRTIVPPGHSGTPAPTQWDRTHLATGMRPLRRDQEEAGPTEPSARRRWPNGTRQSPLGPFSHLTPLRTSAFWQLFGGIEPQCHPCPVREGAAVALRWFAMRTAGQPQPHRANLPRRTPVD